MCCCRSERSGSISPPNYLPESFVQGIKKESARTKSSSSRSTENGHIHHQQQKPTNKQEQLLEKQTGKQTSEQLSTSKQQLTRDQQEDKMQEEPRGQQQQQLHQIITAKLEKNQQHKTMAEGQQKHDSISNHPEHNTVNGNDAGPVVSSIIEPMKTCHTDTVNAWQSEQIHQEEELNDNSEVVENGTKASLNGRTDYITSPESSEGVASPNLIQYKRRSLSEENLDALQNCDDEFEETEYKTSFGLPLNSRLTPQKRAISVDVISPSSMTQVYYNDQEQPIPSRRRSQTIFGEPKRKAPPIPVDRSPTTHNKRPVSSHSSLSDLRRPVQSSVASSSGFSTSGMSYYGKFDILGVLRVRLRGVSIPDHAAELVEAQPPAPLSKRQSVSAGAMAVAEATHGVYCVFTINGGNTSAKSGTCKILPYRPVLWEEDEKEKLFFTNHSRQLFILCRKVPLKKKSKAKASNEVCVGAGVMKIIDINPTLHQQENVDYTSTSELQWYNKTLPMQPKGEIELSVSFEGK